MSKIIKGDNKLELSGVFAWRNDGGCDGFTIKESSLAASGVAYIKVADLPKESPAALFAAAEREEATNKEPPMTEQLTSDSKPRVPSREATYKIALARSAELKMYGGDGREEPSMPEQATSKEFLQVQPTYPKDTLTKDDAKGWYECDLRDDVCCSYWDGSKFAMFKGDTSCHSPLEQYTNFRPLTDATEGNERIAKLERNDMLLRAQKDEAEAAAAESERKMRELVEQNERLQHDLQISESQCREHLNKGAKSGEYVRELFTQIHDYKAELAKLKAGQPQGGDSALLKLVQAGTVSCHHRYKQYVVQVAFEEYKDRQRLFDVLVGLEPSSPVPQPADVCQKTQNGDTSYADRTEAPPGLYNRYVVSKADGTPVDPRAKYFVLRLDEFGDDPQHIYACRNAANRWCDFAPPHLREVASDLQHLLQSYDHNAPAPSQTQNGDTLALGDEAVKEGSQASYDLSIHVWENLPTGRSASHQEILNAIRSHLPAPQQVEVVVGPCRLDAGLWRVFRLDDGVCDALSPSQAIDLPERWRAVRIPTEPYDKALREYKPTVVVTERHREFIERLSVESMRGQTKEEAIRMAAEFFPDKESK